MAIVSNMVLCTSKFRTDLTLNVLSQKQRDTREIWAIR